MRVVAILCPTRFEASELRRALNRAGVLPKPRVRIVVTGIGPECLGAADRHLRAADWVILTGVAGGLTSAHPAGTAWWINEVRDTTGVVIAQPWVPVDEVAGAATIVSTSQITGDPESRSALRVESDATVVDLESVALAREAANHDCRFSIVKGISDDHEAMLPPTIDRWTRPDGSTRLFAVAGALLTGQTSVRQLAVMRRASRRAIEHAAERLMPWITDASEHAH